MLGQFDRHRAAAADLPATTETPAPTPASTASGLMPSFDYSLRSGYSSNAFEDTSNLKSAFLEGELKMRGSIDIDGSTLSYAVWHREKRWPDYKFGNERATGLSLGYKTKLADWLEWAIEGVVSRTKDGDVLAAVPGTVLGYSSADMRYELSSSLAAAMLGGKSTLSASINQLDRGKARFDTDLLLPSKIEADVTNWELSANHIRPALAGELGFTVNYRTTDIPTGEQDKYLRFPASVLRGSIAYGHKFGSNVTLVAEFGAASVSGDKIANSVVRVRPYIHTALEWQATNRLGLGIGYDRDFSITDLDDPLGEYIGTLKLASSLALTEKLSAKLAYEIASSEWLYYDYHTQTRRVTGTLAYAFAKDHRVELEYRRIDRDERDPAQDFDGNQYIARVSGTF